MNVCEVLFLRAVCVFTASVLCVCVGRDVLFPTNKYMTCAQRNKRECNCHTNIEGKSLFKIAFAIQIRTVCAVFKV